jgi:perosamine synthetase
MAVRALGLHDGDEVITTPFSFVASANCLLYERVKPIFADIEEETLGIDPETAEAAATSRTRGLLPVHVFGKPCRISALASIAQSRSWRLIEDSCEALGSAINGRPAGSFGDAAVFAFYPNKQITTGEGGAVVCHDSAVADAIRSMRNQGRDAAGTWMRHIQLGFNYRMDELSAALGVAQLRRWHELQAGRENVVRMYELRLGDSEWLRLPRPEPETTVDWFVYVVRLDAAIDRDAVIADLEARGIPSRDYFQPIHLQPFYRSEFGYREGDFPVTERIARSTIALPFSTRMTDTDVDRVAAGLEAAVRKAWKASVMRLAD